MSYVRLARPRRDPASAHLRALSPAPGWARGAVWRGVGLGSDDESIDSVSDWSDKPFWIPQLSMQVPRSMNPLRALWALSWEGPPLVKYSEDALSLAEAVADAAGKAAMYIDVLGVQVSDEGSNQLIEIVFDWSFPHYVRPTEELRNSIINTALQKSRLPALSDTVRLLRLVDDSAKRWTPDAGVAPLFVSIQALMNPAEEGGATATKAAVDPSPEQLVGGSALESGENVYPLPSRRAEKAKEKEKERPKPGENQKKSDDTDPSTGFFVAAVAFSVAFLFYNHQQGKI